MFGDNIHILMTFLTEEALRLQIKEKFDEELNSIRRFLFFFFLAFLDFNVFSTTTSKEL